MRKDFKNFFFCHTAILPAEIRFRGLLTDNLDATGSIEEVTYDQGIRFSKIKAEECSDNESRAPVPVLHPNSDNVQQMLIGAGDEDYEDCEETTHHDHKDYFYISSVEDWRTLTIPNDAEKEYYTEFNTEQTKGWIILCMGNCEFLRGMLVFQLHFCTSHNEYVQ